MIDATHDGWPRRRKVRRIRRRGVAAQRREFLRLVERCIVLMDGNIQGLVAGATGLSGAVISLQGQVSELIRMYVEVAGNRDDGENWKPEGWEPEGWEPGSADAD